MLVFDKWTCNTNGRQTIFFREERHRRTTPGEGAEKEEQPSDERDYRTAMIDQGFCFNAGEWNYPDAPLRGLYARNRVYEGVIGMESFAPWTERVEKSVTERVLAEVIREIPPQWYEDDYDAVTKLLEQLTGAARGFQSCYWPPRNTTRQPFRIAVTGAAKQRYRSLGKRFMAETMKAGEIRPPEQALAYHILRYVPDLIRDEWVNIGVLVFNPETGERRLRLIEDQDEYNRVRRLHPWADEALLRALRDNLENRLESGIHSGAEIPLAKCVG